MTSGVRGGEGDGTQGGNEVGVEDWRAKETYHRVPCIHIV